MTMDIATLGIRVDATEARLAAIELEKLSTAGGKTAKAMSSVEKSMQGLTGLFAGLGLGALAKSVLDTNREMESLRASLKSVMGSAQGAQGAFNAILTFAKDTPYEIKGLTQTFIMLQNMGIKPTHQVMQSLTDQASKLGGSQETLTSIALQLGQAHSKGKLQMEDMVVLMQRGVPVMKLLGEVTGKNAAELSDMSAKGTITVDMIDKLIVKMGEAAAGSNANAMETLNGKISSLSDAWHSFEDALLNDKSEGYLKTVVSNWTAWLDYFKDSIAGVGKEFLALEEINNKIIDSKAKISAMSQGGVSGAAWQVAGALTGNSIEGEKKRLSDFIKQREVVIKTTHDVIVAKNQETAATDKLLNSTNQEKKALEETLQSKKEHEKAAKAAARAEASLAKSFDDTITALSLNIVEQSQSKRQLEEATLVSKKYNKAMIEQAMVLWDAKTALEAKKQLNEEEKSQLDSLIDRYNKATMSARDYYSSTLTVTSPDGIKSPMSGADKAPLLAQFDKTSGAETAKKAQEDAKTTLDAYNKSLDDSKTKTLDLGGITTAIFDGALGGISLMTGALTTMTDSLAENSKAMAELNKNQLLNNSISDPKERATNFKKYAKEEATLNAKNVQDQLTGTRQMAMAASKMFSEKSAGAKAFHAVGVAIGIAEMAMKVKDMALSAVATAKNIAEGASKLFAQSGWAGFAGVAAMLALMAGLGAMASGGGGGGAAAPPPTDTGTGTVLGDPTAVSESLGKTNDLLKTIHASEYVELRGINRGVNNLKQGISSTVSNIFRNGGLTSVTLAPSSITGIASAAFNPIQKFIGNFLFGGKVTQSVTAQGIGALTTKLADVMNGKNVRAYQFADIKTHTSGGLFTSSKDEYSTQYQKVTKATQDSLNMVFKSIGKTMLEVGSFLGKELGTNLKDTVLNSAIPAMRINLMGLSGEAAAKKLNGVISATMDKMSSKLFGNIIKKYQLLGEGMLETTVRIVAQIVVVKDALAQSGLKLLKEDIVAVSDALAQAAGGLEVFQQQFESFFDKFYSDAEKQTRLQKTLVGSLAEANLILPTTRENYKKLVEGLNMTNPLDQQRYSLLLELSSAADTYYSMLESGAADAAKIAKTQRSLDIQYMELTGDAVGALTEKRKDELAVMDESLRLTQRSIYTLTDANKAVTDATTVANKAVTDAMALASKAVSAAVNDVSKAISNLSSLAQKLRGALTGNTISTDATTRKDRADAQAVLEAALKVANAGGSIDNFAGMDKALTDISKPSEQLYATFTDYARDQALTSGTITQLADYADAQVSMAQKQIDAINGVTNEVIKVNGSIVTMTVGVAGTTQSIVDVNGKIVTLTTESVKSADGTSKEVTRVNGKIVDLIGSSDSTKNAVVNVDGTLVNINKQQIKAVDGTSFEVTKVNDRIVDLTGKSVLTTEGVADVGGEIVKLTRQTITSADGTSFEVTKVNGKIVDLIGSSDGTKSAVIDVNGKMITLTSSQITSALGITDSVAILTEAQKNLATVQDQKTQIEKMLGNNIAVLSVGEAINQLAIALNAQTEITKAIAYAQQTAKETAIAEIEMSKAMSKSEASGSDLRNANADKQKYEDAAYNAQLNIEYIAVRAKVTRLVAKYQASPSAARSKAVNDYLNSVGGKFNEKYDPNPNVSADKMWTLSPKYKGDGSYALPAKGTQTIEQAKATAAGIATLASAIDALIPSLLAISLKDTLSASAAISLYNATLAISTAAAGAVPTFATGGQHSGGWRIVGENGPELEKTGASRIFSNPQSKSLLSMDELLAEIRQLREDARANANAVAKNTAETSRIINRWDGDGMPAARTTV